MLVLRVAFVVLISSTLAFADCSNVTPADANKKILEEEKRLHVAAGVENGFITWSPVVALFLTAGSALEAFFTAANTDFSLHAEVLKGMQVINIRAFEDALPLHAIDIPDDDPNGCRQRFFETLASKYGALY